MTSVKKLWQENWFQGLAPNYKLLYIHMLTRPGINSLGLFVSTPGALCEALNISMPWLEAGLRVCVAYDKIKVFKAGSKYWFQVLDYVETMPRKGPTFEKAVKEYEALPNPVKVAMVDNGIKFEVDPTQDVPDPDEVTQYALSRGYLIDGQEFVDYYLNLGWKDTKGKPIRDWKAKVRRIWCKEERKIPVVKGAPKGYEHFHVVDGGHVITPKSWKNGKPFGESLIEDKLLQKAYDKR